MQSETLYDQFIKDVKKNPDNHCKDVHDAVNRHLKDLEKDWEYVFDRKLADRYISIAKTFRHTKGSWYGKHFNLLPFQGFILASIFGWVEKESGLRRFFKVFIDMGRGGGKSELAALIGNILFLFDGENTPHVRSCATTADQANYVFHPAKSMIKQYCQESDYVNELVNIYNYYVEETKTSGVFKTMTSEANRQDGGDIYCGICDEVHAHRDTSMIKIIETGQGKRTGSSPLLLLITSAGFNKQGPGMIYRKITRDVNTGSVENDGFFGMIFTLDDNEEMHDEKKWIKANPAMPSTPSMRLLRQQYKNAITEGATSMFQFLTKNMNVYADAPKTWIEDEFIKRVLVDKHPEELLKNRDCYIGLDLSQSEDITAAPILFLPTESDPYFRVRLQFWCPIKNKLNGTRSVDGVNYRPWIESGDIYATDGNIIDYEHIRKILNECAEKYNIITLEYDPKFKSQIIPKLQDDGITCDGFSQGYAAMTPPIKWLYENLVSESPRIKIEKNDVFLWMMRNVVIKEYEGGMRITKDGSQGKVDGPVALACAVGGYLTDREKIEVSKYEENDIFLI